MSHAIDWDALRAAAEAALQHAYAPYSSFRVAAALLDEEGQVHVGVNVENASYGLTVCAERNAVAAAVATGSRRFVAGGIICSGRHPVTPCGACRQVLTELPPSFPIRSFVLDPAADPLELEVAKLLPGAFGKDDFAGP